MSDGVSAVDVHRMDWTGLQMRDELVILLHKVEELRVVGLELVDSRALLNAHGREANFRLLEFITFLCCHFEPPNKFVLEKIEPHSFLVIS